MRENQLFIKRLFLICLHKIAHSQKCVKIEILNKTKLFYILKKNKINNLFRCSLETDFFHQHKQNWLYIYLTKNALHQFNGSFSFSAIFCFLFICNATTKSVLHHHIHFETVYKLSYSLSTVSILFTCIDSFVWISVYLCIWYVYHLLNKRNKNVPIFWSLFALPQSVRLFFYLDNIVNNNTVKWARHTHTETHTGNVRDHLNDRRNIKHSTKNEKPEFRYWSCLLLWLG